MNYQDLNDYELLHYVSENIEEANDIVMNKYYPLVATIVKKMEKYIDNCGIESLILLPDKTLLAGVTYPIDNFPSYNFIQFKLNENINLEIVSTKKMVHSWTIYDLKNINIS